MTRWKLALINQKIYLIWLLTRHQKPFYARFSDVISQGNQCRRRENVACFLSRYVIRCRSSIFFLYSDWTVSALLEITFGKLKEWSCCLVALWHLFELFVCFLLSAQGVVLVWWWAGNSRQASYWLLVTSDSFECGTHSERWECRWDLETKTIPSVKLWSNEYKIVMQLFWVVYHIMSPKKALCLF